MTPVGWRLESHLIVPLLAGALWCTVASPAAGAPQAPQAVARPVLAVRLLVDGQPVTDPGLVQLIEMPIGRTLSPAAVRESIVHLMAMGRFEDVQARADEASGGLAITFAATSTRKVTALVFRGDLGLPAGDLRAAVTDHYTSTPPVTRAGDIARMLTTLCRDHGYVLAQVVEHVEPAPEPDRATLAFDIKAGPRVRAGDLSVTGEAGIPAAQVLERCGLRRGQPFDPVVVRRRASDLADSLRAQRYFEATVVPSFAYDASGEAAGVTVAVNRGPLVTLAESVSAPKQDKAEFRRLLQQALEINPDTKPEWRLANIVMQTMRKIREGIASLPEVRVLSSPDMSVLAIVSDRFDVYQIGDELTARGWHLDRQQFPPSLHLTVSPYHAHVVDPFLRDLADAVAQARQPSARKLANRITISIANLAAKRLPKTWVSGLTSKTSSFVGASGDGLPQRSAAMYGLMGTLPNRGDLNEVVLDLLDQLTRM